MSTTPNSALLTCSFNTHVLITTKITSTYHSKKVFYIRYTVLMLTYYEDTLTMPPDNAYADPIHSNKINVEVTEHSAGLYSCQFVEEDGLNILLAPGNI